MATISECKTQLKDAIYSCARTSALTRDVDNALKMADACEKLSRSLNYINQIEESEEK